MKKTFLFCIAFIQICFADIAPDQALQALVAGNKRFSQDQSLHPDRTSERRLELKAQQAPFAIIVGCSDSRVSPEIIFDQGIGDLFIVRVAGNVIGPLELDSVEYSAIYLKSSIVVVLGHENCGAVNAVIKGTTKDIESVAERIQPAVDATKNQKGNRLENTIKVNVKNVVDQLSKSSVIKQMIEKKQITVIGGYYDFHTGVVELLQ
jgi:carbonic anhydrase